VLGLVVGRWLRRRWAAPIVAVVAVLLTVVLNGDQTWNAGWREVWIWTHFHGPFGLAGADDPIRWTVLPGSVFWYVGYQLALCVLGVLIAVLHDWESERTAPARAAVGLAVLAVVLSGLAITGGEPATLPNPIPSPDAGG